MAKTIDLDLVLAAARGRIEAAAGCGKTESVVQLVTAATGRRTLVLTHTLAGVSALQRRLRAAGVAQDRYRLTSIDAWCLGRVMDFPATAGPVPDSTRPRMFYPAVRQACRALLASRALDVALRASYGRVLVDEYQDCSDTQHAIVSELASVLPTVVFGDPLQAVFHWPGQPAVDWHTAVAVDFPLLQTLDHPWRWERAGTLALGRWLINAREPLLAGRGIDLETLPAEIEWRRCSGVVARDDPAIRQVAAYWQRQAGSVLVLAQPKQPQRHRALARSAAGVQVVENFDLQESVDQLSRWENAADNQRLEHLLEIAQSMMTGFAVKEMLGRCATLLRGKAKIPASKDEAIALSYLHDPTWRQAQGALREWSGQAGRRVFRPDVLRVVNESINSMCLGKAATLREAAIAARERRRHQGRSLSRRAVGSTLLLKGLESDYAVVIDVEQQGPEHIYVALTRAARGAVVFSAERVIGRRG